MKSLYKIVFAAILGAVIFTSCEDDKTYTGPTQARFLSKSGDFFIRNLGTSSDTLKFKVQLVGTTNTDVTLNVEADPTSVAVEGVDYTMTKTITIKANEFEAVGEIYGNFAGVADGTIKKLMLKLSSAGVQIVPEAQNITINLRRYCPFTKTAFEGTWTVNETSAYDGAFPAYDVTLTYLNGNPTTKIDTMVVTNLYGYANPVKVILNWSNPSAFKFTIPSQKFFVDGTYGQSTIAELNSGSFSACDMKISTSYIITVTAGTWDKMTSNWVKKSTRGSNPFTFRNVTGLRVR